MDTMPDRQEKIARSVNRIHKHHFHLVHNFYSDDTATTKRKELGGKSMIELMLA